MHHLDRNAHHEWAATATSRNDRRQRRTRRESGMLWLAYAAGYATACVVIGLLFVDWLAR